MANARGCGFWVLLSSAMLLLSCQDSQPGQQKNSSDKPDLGMEPSSQHPGETLKVKPPDEHKATAVGRQETPKAEAASDVKDRGGAIVGRVEKRTDTSIAVRDSSDGLVTLTLQPTTHITYRNEPATLSQFKEGAQVRATYSIEGEDKRINELELLQTASTAGKTTQPN
jgi:hypothetical protein